MKDTNDITMMITKPRQRVMIRQGVSVFFIPRSGDRIENLLRQSSYKINRGPKPPSLIEKNAAAYFCFLVTLALNVAVPLNHSPVVSMPSIVRVTGYLPLFAPAIML